MTKEILKYGVLYYLQKIDKNVSEQRYEPVSYEYWKMLRDLEPTKFGGDYDFYIRLKIIVKKCVYSQSIPFFIVFVGSLTPDSFDSQFSSFNRFTETIYTYG